MEIDDRAITVAEFMRRALYDDETGYYARAARRSGRAGDFFTSIDVGPLFGELLELQLAEMFALLLKEQTAEAAVSSLDLVEAGAGSGRLAADILHAARTRHPAFYESIRLHLVEASAPARAAQRATLGDAADRLATSAAALPDRFEGVLIANELLDAMPVHQVVMTEGGLREVHVQSAVRSPQSVGSPPVRPSSTADCRLQTVPGPLSTPRLTEYLAAAGVQLAPGWVAEISLDAVDWVREAARRLRRGFMILIDYGHEARELYSLSHAAGTLTSFTAHRSAGPERRGTPAWLENPGEQDITAHVDFTSVRAAAEAEGMTTIALLDQTYFLLGLLQSEIGSIPNPQSPISNPQLRTLLLPGGLGSTMKVLILGKNVGTPRLRGCSFKVRMT